MTDYDGIHHDPRLEALMAQAQAACERASELTRYAEEVLARNRTRQAFRAKRESDRTLAQILNAAD